MSTDPTAEHIDAMTRLATTLLAEPGLHAALAASLPAEVMLAALVDRGTLTEQRRTLPDGWAGQTTDGAGIVTMMLRPNTVQRQFVTRWEAAP